MADEVLISITETVDEVTVTVEECISTSEFLYLIDINKKAGTESDLDAGLSTIQFTGNPFADTNYSLFVIGYSSDGLTKIEAFVTNKEVDEFTVYLVDSCKYLDYIALKH